MSEYDYYIQNLNTATAMDVKSLHFTILVKELHNLGIISDEAWKTYVVDTFNNLCISIGANNETCIK